MDARYDVAVIGAGMLGAATAYRLACAGRRVVLLEAREPASGATGNSFSWLNAVSKEPEAYHRLNAAGMAEYAGLAEELGVEFGLHGDGALQWADDPGQQAQQRERVSRLSERGYQAEWLSRAEALTLEPGLGIGEDVPGVAWYAGDSWVDAPRLVRALVNRALAEGAEVWRSAPVRSLTTAGGRVTHVVTEKGAVAVDAVAVCAGVESAALLEPLGVTLPLKRVPGLLAVTTPPVSPLGRVVYAPGVHLRPDADGGLRLGSDDVDALCHPDTPADTLALLAYDLVERAARAFPAAAGVGVERVHLGVRPVPGDGVSIVGRVPGVANAWVAVTHSGITLGPLLGRLLAAEIGGAPPDPRLAPFRPDRFAATLS